MAYGSHNALCQQFLMYKDITHHNCGFIILFQGKQWIQKCKKNVLSSVFPLYYGCACVTVLVTLCCIKKIQLT